MNETGKPHGIFPSRKVAVKTALQGFCKPVQGQILLLKAVLALCHGGQGSSYG